jgi:hypothetical protein
MDSPGLLHSPYQPGKSFIFNDLMRNPDNWKSTCGGKLWIGCCREDTCLRPVHDLLRVGPPALKKAGAQAWSDCSFTADEVERDSDRASPVFAGPPSVLHGVISRDREQVLRG